MDKNDMYRYLREGLLIVFSVLFALFINSLFADYETGVKKQVALDSIKKELKNNASTVARWREKHQKLNMTLLELVEGRNPNLKDKLADEQYLNLGLLTNNENLIDAFLTNTAWETAKTTGIISEFDFETIEKLTHAYTLQEVVTDRTILNILDYYFDTETHQMSHIDSMLRQLQLRFSELVGQENLLVHFYSEAIGALE